MVGDSASAANRSPRFSIIIPARNEELTLPRTLEALTHQTTASAYEVIVVDNGSTDGTDSVVAAHGAALVSLAGRTVSGARNRGVDQSRGEILCFLDADCIPADDWLEAAENSLSDELAVTGSECHIPEDCPWVPRAWFCLQYEDRRRVRCINSANLVVPREVFLRAGGFDESLSTGEDCEFCQRASKLVPVIGDGRIRVVHLGVPLTLWQFYKREVWHGLGALGTAAKNWTDRPLLGTLGFALGAAFTIAGISVRRPAVIIAGCSLVLGVPVLATWYRRRYLRGGLHALQLVALHCVYFLGRLTSLALLPLRNHLYHRNRRRL